MAETITFDLDTLIDTQGASKLLHIPVATLNKWRSTGANRIPFIKIGHQVKYRTRDLKIYIEKHTIR